MSYPVTNEHIRDLSDEVVLAALMRARDSHPLLDKSDQLGLGLAALIMGAVNLCFSIGVINRVTSADKHLDDATLLTRVHAICQEQASSRKMADAYHQVVSIMAALAPMKIVEAADGMPNN